MKRGRRVVAHSSQPAQRQPGRASSPSGERLRLFIAIPAPGEVRSAAGEAIAALTGPGDVRWVSPERVHLTLKFLGATLPETVPAVQESLQEVANIFLQFVLELTGAGAFPSARRPRTIWLGVGGDGLAALTALAEGVERAMKPLGFPTENRPYRAHLTIGRVRSPRGLAELARRIEEQGPLAAQAVAWPVEEFHLVRSDLRPTGPEYTVLGRFGLRLDE